MRVKSLNRLNRFVQLGSVWWFVLFGGIAVPAIFYVLLGRSKEQLRYHHIHRPEFKRSMSPLLFCNKSNVQSEVVYWKENQVDASYISPFKSNHGMSQEKFLTWEYVPGGWNNVRMSVECVLVLAHATGRTLVLPPRQTINLLGKQNKWGMEDFFDLPSLRLLKGLRIITMDEFLARERQFQILVTSRNRLEPSVSKLTPNLTLSGLLGDELWRHIRSMSDANLSWTFQFIVMPEYPVPGTTNVSIDNFQLKRFKEFSCGRPHVLYNQQYHLAHHLHLPSTIEMSIALRGHSYAFLYFEQPLLQQYYRRFVRDYVRMNDPVQCAATRIVDALRRESMLLNSTASTLMSAPNGVYYSLHIRRGDFPELMTRISAAEILSNLRFGNHTPIIPRGALVYIATDDPFGICAGCKVRNRPCESFEIGQKPVGCPEDPSWIAFTEFGWRIRFIHDYIEADLLNDIHPSMHGVVEAIVCSKAEVFAGTALSTFSGYIHRLRGYHSLRMGENTFYHTKHLVFRLQNTKQMCYNGEYWREFREAWTTVDGEKM